MDGEAARKFGIEGDLKIGGLDGGADVDVEADMLARRFVSDLDLGGGGDRSGDVIVKYCFDVNVGAATSTNTSSRAMSLPSATSSPDRARRSAAQILPASILALDS